VTTATTHGRSPTPALLLGLILTLAVVAANSWYLSRQITRLSDLQRDLTDRNRRDSLQLLRIQNDLNQLGLAMRDMLDREASYPLAAWSAQFDRIRSDLDDTHVDVRAGVRAPRVLERQALVPPDERARDTLVGRERRERRGGGEWRGGGRCGYGRWWWCGGCEKRCEW